MGNPFTTNHIVDSFPQLVRFTLSIFPTQRYILSLQTNGDFYGIVQFTNWVSVYPDTSMRISPYSCVLTVSFQHPDKQEE